MKDNYQQLARQKFNRLCPGFEGPSQAVTMSFDGGDERFIVYREITRRVSRDGQTMKPSRRVLVRKL